MAGAIQRKNKQLWTDRRLRKLKPAPPHTEAAYRCGTCNSNLAVFAGITSPHAIVDIDGLLKKKKIQRLHWLIWIYKAFIEWLENIGLFKSVPQHKDKLWLFGHKVYLWLIKLSKIFTKEREHVNILYLLYVIYN